MSAGEIIKSDIKFEDSNGRAVSPGDTVEVIAPRDEGTYGGWPERRAYGILHLRAGGGLHVITEDSIRIDYEDEWVKHRKYLKLKIRNWNWFKTDRSIEEWRQECQDEIDKVKLIEALSDKQEDEWEPDPLPF